MAHALWVRPAINSMKKLLFVQEEIASQYALIAQFLEEIAGRYGHLTKGILQIPRLPACETCRASANFCSYKRSNPALSSGTTVKAGESPFGNPLARPLAGLKSNTSMRNLEQRSMYLCLPYLFPFSRMTGQRTRTR